MKKLNKFLWGLVLNPTFKNQVILSILFCLLFSPVIWWICNFVHKPKPVEVVIVESLNVDAVTFGHRSALSGQTLDDTIRAAKEKYNIRDN